MKNSRLTIVFLAAALTVTTSCSEEDLEGLTDVSVAAPDTSECVGLGCPPCVGADCDTSTADAGTGTVDTFVPECSSDGDCNADIAQCQLNICLNGTCTVAPAADGVTCTPETASPCSLGSACKAGDCIEVVDDCDDDDSCTTDSCNAATNQCENTAIENCGAECIVALDCAEEVDGCNVPTCIAGECGQEPVPDGTPCANSEWTGNLCIVAGRCTAGACTPQDKNCDDGIECTSDSCVPETGCLNEETTEGCSVVECTTAADCVTSLVSNPCKKIACENSKCVAINADGDACIPVGEPSLCLEGGTCQEGDCIAQAKLCDDGVDCTLDTCNPATGECESEPQGEGCGGDKLCSTDEECAADEFCDKGLVPVIGEDLCKPKKDDGQFCTGNTQCASGTCGGCITIGESIQSGWCYTASTKATGELCKVDDECTSGSCSATCPIPGPGACECQVGTDCAANEWCDLGGFGGLGQNECKPQKGECQSCGTDEQCLSGTCVGDGLLTGGTCVTEASLDDGSTCCENSQCKSGKCEDAVCVGCTSNGDCDAETQYCTDQGACVAKKELDALCGSNDECQTGQCEGIQQKQCVCGVSEDCPEGQYCSAILGVKNSCQDATAECESCTPGLGECGVGGECNVAAEFSFPKCIIPSSKAPGEPCCRDKQCISNSCENDVCE